MMTTPTDRDREVARELYGRCEFQFHYDPTSNEKPLCNSCKCAQALADQREKDSRIAENHTQSCTAKGQHCECANQNWEIAHAIREGRE